MFNFQVHIEQKAWTCLIAPWLYHDVKQCPFVCLSFVAPIRRKNGRAHSGGFIQWTFFHILLLLLTQYTLAYSSTYFYHWRSRCSDNYSSYRGHIGRVPFPIRRHQQQLVLFSINVESGQIAVGCISSRIFSIKTSSWCPWLQVITWWLRCMYFLRPFIYDTIVKFAP